MASIAGTTSAQNSSTTPLAAGSFFTGEWVDVSAFNSVLATCLTTQNGILYVEFSEDGSNLDSLKSYSVVANVTLTQSTDVAGKYCRVRLLNTSVTAQTSLSLVSTLNTSDFFNVEAEITDSVLPDGAATSALQSTGNNTLKQIETATENIEDILNAVKNKISTLNTTTALLTAGATYTGTWET